MLTVTKECLKKNPGHSWKIIGESAGKRQSPALGTLDSLFLYGLIIIMNYKELSSQS